MKKCIKKIGSLFLWMLMGLAFGAVFFSLAHQVYEILYKWMPDTFPLYGAVTQKEQYRALNLTLSIIAMLANLFLVTYLSARFNNDRFEFIISKTDGFYKIPDILRTYVYNFGISDLISSIICGAIFSIPVYFIPERFFSAGNVIVELLSLSRTLAVELGAPLASILTILGLILSHATTLPLALKFYRAKWLTGFAEA